MKIKKSYLVAGIIVLLLVGWAFARFVVGGNEDTWIKDSRGVYVKHGNPSAMPSYVLIQQNAILCAYNKFDDIKGEINSQCIGICEDYAIDLVHVPRTKLDNLIQNQCQEYLDGTVNYFIELNQKGEVVRIV